MSIYSVISIAFGAFVIVYICVQAWRAGLLVRGVDQYEDGAESERAVAEIAAATQPAVLQDESGDEYHPHVRAGSTWIVP